MICLNTIISDPLCTSEFSWMQNSLGQEPCVIAGYLQSQCGNESWNITSLSPQSHYQPPFGEVTNCQCSWAVYNTIQACASCQANGGQDSILSWAQYITNCTGRISNEDYFPKRIAIPDGTAIPYWATEDPTKWPNGIFDTNTAQFMADKEKEDVTQESRTKESKRVQANSIAGGIAGGIVGTGLLGVILYLLWRRRRSRYSPKPTITVTPGPEMTLPVPYASTSNGSLPRNATAPQSGIRDRNLSREDAVRQIESPDIMVTSPTAPSISVANATVYTTDISSSYGIREQEPLESIVHPFVASPIPPGPMGSDRKYTRSHRGHDEGLFDIPHLESESQCPPSYSTVAGELGSYAEVSLEARTRVFTLSEMALLHDVSSPDGTDLVGNSGTGDQVNRSIHSGDRTSGEYGYKK